MSYRVQCSACGKVMTLDDDAAGQPIVCIACGARLEAPPPPPVVQAVAVDAEPPPTAPATLPQMTRAPSPSPASAARVVRKAPSAKRTFLVTAGASFVVVLLTALAIALILNARDGGRRAPGDRSVTSAEMRNNADLLKLKSEAEALAIEGRLAEAHEKYRQLQQLWAGRDIKDPLMWDLMERAKVDADNIFTILLRKQAPLPESTPTVSLPPDLPARAEPPDTGPAPQQDEPGTQAEAMANAASQPATGPAATQPGGDGPTLVADVVPVDAMTDEQIAAAMKRGIDYLLVQFQDGELAKQAGVSDVRRQGMDALCVYALLTAGPTLRDERLDWRGDFMKGLVARLKTYDLRPRRGELQQPITYARSLRAAALATSLRPDDKDTKKVLKDDVDWLVAAAINGAYTYDDQLTRGAAAFQDEVETPEDGRRLVFAHLLDARELLLRSYVPSPLPSPGGRGRTSRTILTPAGGTSPYPPLPPGEGRGEGTSLLDALWNDDARAPVIPIHGIHDPRTGRELYVPPSIPMDTRTQIPGGYPPRGRTSPPGTGGPNTRVPDGWYGGGQRMAPQTPGRGDDPGSLSGPFPWDNSNSQYGLLGVWSGAEAGIEVPTRYWRDVEKHWVDCQLTGGEWGYKSRDTRGSFAMTCGGVASLYVTHDWIVAPLVKGAVGRDPLTKPLATGLSWLEQGDNAVNTPNPRTHYLGYDLYGLERVALASGFKYFGKHDWYRELAATVLGMQWPTGAWGHSPDGPDSVVDTAYVLLFLARGRYPILMNKLRFEQSDVVRADGKPSPGYWSNRPRDVANLTRFASRQLERGLNWQVASLRAPWYDWLDSPVLYIASHQPPVLEEADYEKLRNFVEAGGVIFTHADNGAAQFNKWVGTLVEKVTPGRKLEDLPADHPLFDVSYKIKSPPQLQAVGNGSRLLLVHSPTDLATQWQQRADKVAPDAFRVGVNLFLYAAGRADLRNRLNSPYIPEPKRDPQGSVRVARLRYAGNWDPEPGAWQRFARYFQWQTNFKAEVTPVELSKLKPEDGLVVAHLTGTGAAAFTDADAAAVKSFVEAGGILLVDPCGGSQEFADGVRDLLAKAFPQVRPEAVPPEHPLLRAAGEKESLSLKVRPYVAESGRGGSASIQMLQAGKGFVVQSPLDLTSGLLGTNTWGIAGFEPASSQTFVRNLLLWAHAK